MNTKPVVAVVVGGETEEIRDRENQSALRAALVLLRAVLDRDGRVLLAAEAGQLVPLLMAAAEYRAPREVEGGGENVPAPVILGPVLATDSMEGRILTYRPETEGEVSSPSLLEDLVTGNLIEVSPNINKPLSGPQAFLLLLESHQPSGIFAVGHSPEMPSLLESAEDYAERASNRLRLFRLLARDRDREGTDQWKPVDDPTEGRDLFPPRLDGEILRPSSEGRQWDEGLLEIAQEASREAAWALELDGLTAALIGLREKVW
jgi:hypothetical protein